MRNADDSTFNQKNMKPKISIIINDQSGNGKGIKIRKKLLYKLKKKSLLEKHIINVQKAKKTYKKEVIKKICNDSSIILICGGDGTVHHTIKQLINQGYGKQISIFPIGTGNDLSRNFNNQEKNIFKFIKKITKNPSYGKIDLFSLNDKITFINYFSLGMDAYILSKYEKLIKRLPKFLHLKFLRKLYFTSIGLYCLVFYHKKVVEQKSNKQHLSLIVSNIKNYAGGSTINYYSSSKDGKIEIIPIDKKTEMIKVALQRFPIFNFYFKSLTITPPVTIKLKKTLPIQIDGEDYSKTFANDKELNIKHAGHISICF